MTDQYRADCLGYRGHPVVKTPHLDSLAATGVVFENAFCQSPACMASRASLFTGRYPTTVRVRGMGVLPPVETTFPEVLRRRGYRTGAFGKVHLTPEQYTLNELHEDTPTLDWRRFAKDAGIPPIPDDPFKDNYGFETYVGCEDVLLGKFRSWLKKKNPALAKKKSERLCKDGPGDLFVSPYPSEFHPSTFIAEQAAEYIKTRSGESSPWFTFCSFIAPHHPFEAPLDQLERYDIESIPLPSLKGGVEPAFIPAPASLAIGEMDQYPNEVKRLIVLHYLASISLIDDGVGLLLSALEQSGQLDNTMIVFTSDHGEFLGNHGLLRKPSLHYDETLRVPLLIRLPEGRSGGRRVSGLVELTDVHPTLLGLLGLPVNNGVQGIDWSTRLQTGEGIGRADVYADMFDLTPRFVKLSGPYMAVQTLRTDHWKLNIYPTAGRQYGQLFDLQNDPDESQNRYADAKFRDIREELLWRLASRMHENTDPLPFWLTQF
ncbi:MAG: sulfatase-like hydrolase/transferase [Kiritimatiellae bacterium]|nr:sulfatase-like hydrolase/transferase [Kiritimatiellia bacterium]